jgi:hypothetical protein
VHAYATDSRERYFAPILVGAVSIALSYILSIFANRCRIELPWWLDSPTPLFLFGVTYAVYNRWLWRLPMLSRLPNLAGNWAGTVSSSHEPTVHNSAILRIRQTWSAILVELETQHSRSASCMASLALDRASEPTLSYEYWNEPKSLAAESMQPHRGTACLRIKGSARRLEGDYYTGRGRTTVGEMRFESPSCAKGLQNA